MTQLPWSPAPSPANGPYVQRSNAEEIARDASWLAQALDPAAGMVRLIAMDREAYRAASFLDDRLLQAPVDAQIVPWPLIEEAMSGELRHDARWIFHIGHVGSTLLSRLLGELDGVLAVREPRLLRDLALSPPDVRATLHRACREADVAHLRRVGDRLRQSHQLRERNRTGLVPTGERALFMYATPRNYIASILAGENSLQELRMLAGGRARSAQTRATSTSRHKMMPITPPPHGRRR